MVMGLPESHFHFFTVFNVGDLPKINGKIGKKFPNRGEGGSPIWEKFPNFFSRRPLLAFEEAWEKLVDRKKGAEEKNTCSPNSERKKLIQERRSILAFAQTKQKDLLKQVPSTAPSSQQNQSQLELQCSWSQGRRRGEAHPSPLSTLSSHPCVGKLIIGFSSNLTNPDRQG